MIFEGNKARREAIVLAGVGVALWSVAISLDAFDHLISFIQSHESWELDEIILASVIVGFLGLLFSGRRLGELNRQIHSRRKAEQDVSWLANHDALTKLGNRRALDKLAELNSDRLPEGQTQAVLSIDLDGFKKLNDLLGHYAGDLALIEVAARLNRVLPEAKIFRAGGDEFVAVISVSDEEEALAAARRVLVSIGESYQFGKTSAELGASVGVALHPLHAGDVADVIHYADVAMYAAKRNQDGVLPFEASMQDELVKRTILEASLRQALKDGSIRPYYQPLIDLSTGQVNGFEALARWTDASGNSVPPSDFIPLAEETGLIIELADQLLAHACREAVKWPTELRLAFNISPAQLTDKLLGLRILRILSESGLSPSRLEIEITETALVRDIVQAERILSDLHDAGIGIALDDFGTGYSSLSQLSKFKFDQIKIDRSFVASFQGDEKQEKIVRAMIGLGHGLGLSTTAEGIENSEQLEALKQLGCDVGQGYLFGKAMPSTEVLRFLQCFQSFKRAGNLLDGFAMSVAPEHSASLPLSRVAI